MPRWASSASTRGRAGHDGPGGGAALLLSAGHLIGILVQTVPDAQQFPPSPPPGPGSGRPGCGGMDRDRAMFSKAVGVSSRLQSWKMRLQLPPAGSG